ncbi:hypothetical protein [Cryobacterium zhongshanensis]|uniref:Uncharacterized protein n=1 Tax=Cryobacterium zhongshanensis TaxID=2928153 RepID=A0AA41UHB9_9MICO|nr:hypothetical protein [Cryobacterium zhongshanensis]MCI4659750.1 hypothetical protein [Cryobacterium zhongshanensis]
MALNNRTARRGDKFKLDGGIFTVHTISAPGTGGRSYAVGPIIGAHLHPGGYAITIDEGDTGVEWIERRAAHVAVLEARRN